MVDIDILRVELVFLKSLYHASLSHGMPRATRDHKYWPFEDHLIAFFSQRTPNGGTKNRCLAKPSTSKQFVVLL